MNYFDPARPRICGRPAYVAEGKAIAPLPLFCVEPKEGVGYTVSFMLIHNDGGGVWYEKDVTWTALADLLLSWGEDPEGVLADLGWTYRLPREPEPEWSEEDDEALAGMATLLLDDIE